jgi:hypothetical protein
MEKVWRVGCNAAVVLPKAAIRPDEYPGTRSVNSDKRHQASGQFSHAAPSPDLQGAPRPSGESQ